MRPEPLHRNMDSITDLNCRLPKYSEVEAVEINIGAHQPAPGGAIENSPGWSAAEPWGRGKTRIIRPGGAV